MIARIRYRWLGLLVLPFAAAFACIPDVVPDLSSLPRCEGVEPACGPMKNEPCCDTADGVKGGDFVRDNDAGHANVVDFKLDRFEVTVGRFRRFVESYPVNRPRAGDGLHPHVANSGWRKEWDANLPADRAALESKLGCDVNFRTWSSTPEGEEERPMNCVNWYVAFAFCAWDGGRLPTELEWNYAAAGGNNQSAYPWGSDAPDSTHAVYNCGMDDATCAIDFIQNVGSRSPKGDGRWRQADLGGGMFEWTLDWYTTYPAKCDSCANVEGPGTGRAARGGDWYHGPDALSTTARIGFLPEEYQDFLGFRCARD
jgi:formylglycine-generating enzyme required for sulfatase activity